MEIIINGNVSDDPRDSILAIEAVTQSLCERAGQDAADGTMMLLTAAVHITMKRTRKPFKDVAVVLAESLGAAFVAADEFFKLRDAQQP